MDLRRDNNIHVRAVLFARLLAAACVGCATAGTVETLCGRLLLHVANTATGSELQLGMLAAMLMIFVLVHGRSDQTFVGFLIDVTAKASEFAFVIRPHLVAELFMRHVLKRAPCDSVEIRSAWNFLRQSRLRHAAT